LARCKHHPFNHCATSLAQFGAAMAPRLPSPHLVLTGHRDHRRARKSPRPSKSGANIPATKIATPTSATTTPVGSMTMVTIIPTPTTIPMNPMITAASLGTIRPRRSANCRSRGEGSVMRNQRANRVLASHRNPPAVLAPDVPAGWHVLVLDRQPITVIDPALASPAALSVPRDFDVGSSSTWPAAGAATWARRFRTRGRRH